jgi:hypothetical protein
LLGIIQDKSFLKKLPESLKKEFLYNLIRNSEKSPEIADNLEKFRQDLLGKTPELAQSSVEYLGPDLMNKIAVDSVNQADSQYIELPEDNTKGEDIEDTTNTQYEIDTLMSDGWVDWLDYIMDSDSSKEIDILVPEKIINGRTFVKLKKND